MAPQPFVTKPLDQWGLGLERPLLIAGPCSAETEEQVMDTARGIVRHTPQVKVFRAGIWKPRTRPGGFEGVGDAALSWLRRVKEEAGLLTIVEVATATHVEQALAAGVDMLWIGARTTPNPFSVQAIADALEGLDVPVFVKNPINPDLHLWIGALERLSKAGITRLAAIHRGFSWFERTPYRNSPMWEFPIRLKAAFPGLPLICDPSHISGHPGRLGEIAQQALDLNFSGLMVEAHRDPAQARSDAQQQITPEELATLFGSLIFREALPGSHLRDELQEYRDLIDQLDEEIAQKLATRMDIAERIGEFKRAHNVAILQPERWERVMARQRALCLRLGLDPGFIDDFMAAIHNESIRRQTAVPHQAPASGSRGSLMTGEGPLDI
ncbi:MAG: chorismate mutase [Flavobacteriales bacterium]